MKFRCRMIKPTETQWEEIEAESAALAANEYMHENYRFGISIKLNTNRGIEVCTYGLIEVEGHGTFIARTFRSQIWRRGGIPSPSSRRTLKDIADALDVPLEEIDVDGPWIGEEPYPGEKLEDYYGAKP